MSAPDPVSPLARWRVLPASAFDSIAAQWDALNDAGFRSPLLTAAFVRQLLRHFGNGRERIALYARNDSDDGANAPLLAACIVDGGSLVSGASFQPSQAPIGLWLQAVPQNLSMATLARELMARLGPLQTVFNLLQLDPDFDARPDATSERILTSDYIQTARITIDGSFDGYWAARGKNLRANMKKQRSKLEAEGLQLSHTLVTAPQDVAAAIADYGRLEAAGWKAAGGTAVTADNVQGRFYRALLEDYCSRGAGRIYRYFYGDQVVAMDLCVAHAGTMVILKTAFDESIKGSSPALLMRHEYLPAIFEQQTYRRIEFYGRVMDWHTKWTDEIRTLYHATIFRWGVAERLYRWRAERRAEKQTQMQAAPAETPPIAVNHAAG